MHAISIQTRNDDWCVRMIQWKIRPLSSILENKRGLEREERDSQNQTRKHQEDHWYIARAGINNQESWAIRNKTRWDREWIKLNEEENNRFIKVSKSPPGKRC